MRAKQDAQGIYDFDALVIEPRLARVGGEVVDVSTIPVGVVLRMAKFQDRDVAVAEAERDANGTMAEMFQMVSDVCVVSNPKITPEFLMAHLNYAKFAVFMKFVLSPMTDKAEEFMEAEEGNAATDEAQSD